MVLSKDIERTLRYLCFTSLAVPFGRPIMSAIAACINHFDPCARVDLNHNANVALKIQEIILIKNCGSSYDFLLYQIPWATEEIFVDASSWGIGGFLGDNYFLFPNSDLQQFHNLVSDKTSESLAPTYFAELIFFGTL